MNLLIVLAQVMLFGASLIGILFGCLGLFYGISDGIRWILLSTAGLAISVIWFRIFTGRAVGRLEAQVKKIAPNGYEPIIEASAPAQGQYIGIAPNIGSVVVIDKKRGIAQHMSIDKVQRWEFEEDKKGSTFLVLWFRDLALPSVRVFVPEKNVDDTASRLRTVLQF